MKKHRTANARSISSSLLDEPIEAHDPATIHAAALTIAEHARDAEDMRVLLAMCGIVHSPRGVRTGRSSPVAAALPPCKAGTS